MKSIHKYSFWEYILFPPVSLNRKKLDLHLTGKTIFITGASYGIGEALSRLLAGLDLHLILTARTEEKLVLLKSKIERQGTRVTIFPCDLYNPDECTRLIRFLKEFPGGIDIFVSNAGKSIRRSLFDSLDRFHDFQRTMSLNYFTPVQLCLNLIPILQKNKGHIISVSAVNVLLSPTPYWAAYQASKSAFDQWFRCIVPELDISGIKTTSIYLPLVKTRMIEPTSIYRNTPAMKPEQAAMIIAKSILTQKHNYKPWWLFPCQLISLTGNELWRKITTFYLKRK